MASSRDWDAPPGLHSVVFSTFTVTRTNRSLSVVGAATTGTTAVDRQALAHQPPDQRVGRGGERFGRRSAPEGERLLHGDGIRRTQQQRRQVDALIEGLVPGHVGGAVDLEAVDGDERRLGCRTADQRLHRAALHLQAAHPHPEHHMAPTAPGRSAASAPVEQALRPGRPALGAVRSAECLRHQHAPLEAHLVLPAEARYG